MMDARRPSDHHGVVSDACVFCDIVRGTVAADVVWDDDVAVAFLDRSPLFHGHTLVVPRRHVLTLPDLDVDEVGPYFERVRLIASAMPGALGAQGTFVANNNVVSQSVAHLHVHVVPRTRGDGLRGFFWPRHRYADGEAAVVADALRQELDALSAQ
jgi:histidine triad (HIT) family protein